MKSIGEYHIEKGNLDILYCVVDDSFSHEFGTQKQVRTEQKFVQYYIAEVDSWVDAEVIEAKLPRLSGFIEKLIEEDFEKG